jgi:hypothetical protein
MTHRFHPIRAMRRWLARSIVGVNEMEERMEEHDRELGPIDIVVIAYPAGSPMTGDAAPMLVDLVDRGIVRVLDMMFVAKEADGGVIGFEAKDLDSETVGAFKAFEGASSGMLGNSDVQEAADALEPGEAGLVIVYENKWVAPFAAAVRRNGGVLIANQRVPLEAVVEALDAAEATV